MAISDGISARIFPKTGESAPLELVASAPLTGSASATLIDVSGTPAWALAGGTLSSALLQNHTIGLADTSTGATYAIRLRVTNWGATDYVNLALIDDGAENGLKLGRIGTNLRGRYRNTALTATTNGVTVLNTVFTFVYRVSNRDGIAFTHEGNAWWKIAGRAVNDPQALSTANILSATLLNSVVLDASTVTYDLLDLVYWNRELTDAEAAAVADDIRSAIPAPSGGDTSAPTLTSPSATATGATTASGSVTTNEGNGTLYYLASANATETDVTVKAGSSQAVTATGNQSVTITGLTAATPYYPHYLHRDAAGNDSAVASGAQFTTGAPSGDTDRPTLTGAITFSSVTQTSYTASWPAGLDNVAITGYEYQIGSTAGAWTDAGNSLSAAITGRTAGTTETVYVRAYDAAGLRSTPAISGSVTLESIPASGINVTEPLKNNTGTVLANLSGVGVAILSASDFTYGLTTNASGILSTISDAAITAGQQYHVAIKLADGSVGITGPITAS